MAKTYTEEILRALRFAALGFHAGRSEVIIPAGRKDIIAQYSGKIQRLPNIFMRTVKDRYPLYKKSILKRDLYKLPETDEVNTCSGGVLLLDPFKLLQIFYAVTSPVEDNYIDRAIITENGRYLIPASGREKVSDLLEKAGQSPEGFLVRESLLNGESAVNPAAETVAGTRAFFIVKENQISLSSCIGCGICVRLCPANLNITYSRRVLEKGKGLFNFKETADCLECGLCGFFCPAFKD